MRTDAPKQVLCRKKYTKEQIADFKKFVSEEYRVNMYLQLRALFFCTAQLRLPYRPSFVAGSATTCRWR
jgi:hypothetical protein